MPPSLFQHQDASIDIGICTYRRPQLKDTLLSLSKLHLGSALSVRVIVADNDVVPSAKALVDDVVRATSLNVLYVHAPSRNISIARNACLDAAKGPLLAFIDDDEVASPEWLLSLINTMETTDADVVLGPVQATYAPDCPAWICDGDFHSTRPVWVNGQIVTGYSGNTLIHINALALLGKRFRINLGRSGGEDTAFFTDVYNQGGRIAFSPQAIVNESVPPVRASLAWLAKQRFRSGQTHGMLLLEKRPDSIVFRCMNIIVAGLKALFCFSAMPFFCYRKTKMFFWLLRGAMHIGVVARLMGKREIEHYGQ